MNEMQIFNSAEFGEVRTVMVDNEPWFVGKDVSSILGYAKPLNALAKHVQSDDSLKRGLIDSKGRMQETILINESGLYSLIFGSKLESAQRFKRWVTNDVLPTLRKTGAYGTAQLPKSKMELLRLTYEAMDELKSEISDVKDDLEDFKMDLPLLPIETDRLTEIAKRKGVYVLGGKNSNAYRDRSMRTKVYKNIYSHITYQFGVKTYKAIKRNQCQKAIDIINNYVPPVFLQDEIEAFNAQTNLF